MSVTVNTDASAPLEERERRSSRVAVLSEPLTYQARLVHGAADDPLGMRAVPLHRDRSYVGDLVRAQKEGDPAARERLDRHGREMKSLAEERQRMFFPGVDYEFERRAVNWVSGTGGYFAPPLWIVEQFATVPTPERVLSSLAPQFDLPVGAQSVNLPRWTAGADVGDVPTSQSAGFPDVADAAVSSAVATIAGNADVPLQMLEQSPVGAHLDWAVFSNMEARYGYRLEQQLLVGAGVAVPQGSGNNQLLGILNNTSIPSANVITYTDTSPTVAKIVGVQSSATAGGSVPQAVAQVGNNRKVKPEAWLMTTSRAAWFTSGEVSFPLALANQTGPGAFDLMAYPVKQDDAIPTNLGVNSNQDTIIACRPSDWLILESDRHTQIMPDVLAGTMQVRLQMRRYVAALLRQPTSVAYISGSGLTIPAGF